MKKLILAFAAAAALGGCASDGMYGGGYSSAYYDNAYGPFYDGYWQGDAYWYSPGPGRPYLRDDGHHFSHRPGHGYHGVHGRGGHHRDHDDHDHHDHDNR